MATPGSFELLMGFLERVALMTEPIVSPTNAFKGHKDNVKKKNQKTFNQLKQD